MAGKNKRIDKLEKRTKELESRLDKLEKSLKKRKKRCPKHVEAAAVDDSHHGKGARSAAHPKCAHDGNAEKVTKTVQRKPTSRSTRRLTKPAASPRKPVTGTKTADPAVSSEPDTGV